MTGDPWPLLADEDYCREVAATVGEERLADLARIRLVVLDCDGVLTRANLIYGPDGEALKEFDARDGLGLMMARAAGLKRALLTGRNSAAVARRCRDLRFESLKLGRLDKLPALDEILAETGCEADETLYVGDDLLDLPAMARVRLAVTVPGAPAEVTGFAAYQTRAAGGQGAVREVCDLVLKSRGLYRAAVRRVATPDPRTPEENS